MKAIFGFLKSIVYWITTVIAFVVYLVVCVIAPVAFFNLILSTLFTGEPFTLASFMLRANAFTGYFLIFMPGALLFASPFIYLSLLDEKTGYFSSSKRIILFVVAVLLGGAVSFIILAPILGRKAATLENFLTLSFLFWSFSNEKILSNSILASDIYDQVTSLVSQYGINKLQANIISITGIILSVGKFTYEFIANLEGNISFYERVTGRKKS